MDLNRLRMLLAAPLASLFVVLILCVLAVRRPEPAVGIRIPMMKLRATPLSNCEFNGFTLHLSADGRVSTFDTEIPENRVSKVVTEVMEYRVSRVVYVIADPNVRFDRLMNLLDRIDSVKPTVHIAVVPPEAEVGLISSGTRSSEQRFVADRCRFEVPGGDD